MFVGLIASNFGWSCHEIEELDAISFLKYVRVAQKQQADASMMAAHANCMVNADSDGWNDYLVSLGYTPIKSELARAAGTETDLTQLMKLQQKMAAGDFETGIVVRTEK